MQNLEQIRARNTLAFAKSGAVFGKQGGDVIKKISPLVLNHGLLATAAYSFTEHEGWQKVFDAIALHLADPDIAILPADGRSRHAMMDYLSGPHASSETLKRATAETMAWLGYARRFVTKNKPDTQGE